MVMLLSCLISSDAKQELCKKMASNLATLRTKANLKQEELAERLGLSRQTISAIENERRVMEWTTFSVLVLFFAKDEEIEKVMIALGILNDCVVKIFNLDYGR